MNPVISNHVYLHSIIENLHEFSAKGSSTVKSRLFKPICKLQADCGRIYCLHYPAIPNTVCFPLNRQQEPGFARTQPVTDLVHVECPLANVRPSVSRTAIVKSFESCPVRTFM